MNFSFYVHFPSCELSELITRWPIYSIGLPYLLGDFSSEQARPMYSTTNWVNETEARLLDRNLGFWPAYQNIHDTPQNELLNLTTCFTMVLGSSSSPCTFLCLSSFVCTSTCTSLQIFKGQLDAHSACLIDKKRLTQVFCPSRMINESVCLEDRACQVYRCLAIVPFQKKTGVRESSL